MRSRACASTCGCACVLVLPCLRAPYIRPHPFVPPVPSVPSALLVLNCAHRALVVRLCHACAVMCLCCHVLVCLCSYVFSCACVLWSRPPCPSPLTVPAVLGVGHAPGLALCVRGCVLVPRTLPHTCAWVSVPLACRRWLHRRSHSTHTQRVLKSLPSSSPRGEPATPAIKGAWHTQRT